MSAIRDVHARRILDSRGTPTDEVDVALPSVADCRTRLPS
jgi:enolase